ncbi:MAG: capsule assembly Wzi family protein [Planctomycetota bacterium]
MRAAVRLFSLFAALVLAAASASALQSVDVPADRAIYDLLDDLARAGALPSRVAGVKPLPRLEIARLLEEAARLAPRSSLSSVLRERLEHARGRFETDITIYRKGLEGISMVRPVDELRLNVRQDGAHREFERDGGRAFDEGLMAFASVDAYGHLPPGVSFMVQPEARWERLFDTGEGDRGASVHLMESYARLSFLGLDLTAGREALRWGQGHHDTLILSDNAEPLNLARLATNYTSLSLLGPMRAELFLARLENDRDYPHTLLGGMKLNFKPWPFIELGLSRTFQFGGEGRSIPMGEILFPSTSTENVQENREEDDPSNQLAGFDWRLQPGGWLGGLVLYGEAIGEDIAWVTPSRYSYLLGAELSRPLGLDDVSLVTEYAWTHELAYVHNVYTDGYTYRGEPLGHHVGQDGRDFFLGLTWDFDARTRFSFGYDREEQNHHGAIFPDGDPRNEIAPVTNELRFGLRRLCSEDLEVSAELRWAHVDDAEFEEGRTERELLWQLGVSLYF